MRIIGNDPNTPRQTQVVASGTLSTGDTVIVNADGTVSVVSGVAQSIGSSVVFEAATTRYVAAVFDSNSNKVVVVYRDNGNSEFGTAIVGTVSGTSISFGSPATFGTSFGADYISATFDSNSNKVVVAYANSGQSLHGTAVVGTVSGTSISFGTPVVFNSSGTDEIGTTFDSNSNKVVIAYRDSGNSSYGTAIVGTVSGTSISFGSESVFESANSSAISAVFDSSNNKVVVAYRDNGNSSYGTAVVGTVSGTSISFGTPVVFKNSSVKSFAVFDSNSNKVVIGYADGSNSNYGTAIVGTVSGTSISFGSAVVVYQGTADGFKGSFDSNANKVIFTFKENGATVYGVIVPVQVSGSTVSAEPAVTFFNGTHSSLYTVFDSNSNKTVINYTDNGNSQYGNSIVFQAGSTNLTAENYIGTAKSGAADGDGVVVNTQGNVADIPATYYDLANASYDSVSFSVSSQDTFPTGVTFNPSGTKMYVVGNGNDRIYEYDLSTANDVSTATYNSVSFDNSSQATAATGMVFNNDGTKMYIVSGGLSRYVYQYSLSTAYDVSSASYDSVSLNVGNESTDPTDLRFNNDGSKLFVLQAASADSVFQYSLTSNFDLSTASYDSVSFSVGSQDSTPTSLSFNSDGSKMFIIGLATDKTYQYSLSTNFDISTASYDNISFDQSVSTAEGQPRGLAFSNYGDKLYVIGYDQDTVYEFSTSVALTAGQSYYVQTDGTITTTAGDPSVFAGTAVSATKLIVKG